MNVKETSIIVLSTSKAKCRVVAQEIYEVVWMELLVKGLKCVGQRPIQIFFRVYRLYCIRENPKSQARTKQIEVHIQGPPKFAKIIQVVLC